MRTELGTKLMTWLSGRSFDDLRQQFHQTGYIVFDEVLSEQEVAAIREALKPYLGDSGQFGPHRRRR